jgi:hypothetical protein
MPYARLSRGPLLFKSFTGLAAPEFDVIVKEIESKYEEHERKRFSNRKRQREVGAADRPFKLIVKERFFLMLLVYYFRLYICVVRTSFDLDKSNVYRDISINEPLVKIDSSNISLE